MGVLSPHGMFDMYQHIGSHNCMFLQECVRAHTHAHTDYTSTERAWNTHNFNPEKKETISSG